MSDLRLKAPINNEPKLKSRFTMRFPDDIGLQPIALTGVTSPKINIDTQELSFINTKTYYATSFHWEKMTISMRDYLAPSTAQALMEWIRLCAESTTGRMGYHIGFAKDIYIDVLDPVGRKVSTWYLNKCIISGSVNFGDFSYDEAKIIDISFDILPQYCTLLF